MIDKNIAIASTPSGKFYCSNENYLVSKEKIFAKTWHYIGDINTFNEKDYLYPICLLEGCLDEPLIISTHNQNQLICMSNVCTHRGFVLIDEPTKANMIRCRYHGRCYHPNGKFLSMPEFEEAQGFPSELDHLKQLKIQSWGGLLFTSLFPEISLEEILKPIYERLNWFPFEKLKLLESPSQDFHINANWALYCDNYLEGFHIPFVHKSLNKVIDYGNYETHLFPFCNLQLGIAKDSDVIFDIPESSPDFGKKVAAYYWWIFPNMMMNFYPWGLSLNIVRPKGVDKTTVSFITYISDESKYNSGAGSDLNKVELEDEEVVESVQKGLRSRLYFRGRYSPKMEKGVHHFHQLFQSFLEK